MDKFWETIMTLGGLIAAVAIISVLVSKNAQTPQVVQSLASGYANNIATAISPVTGANATPNLSYPSSGGFGSGLPTFGGSGMPSFMAG